MSRIVTQMSTPSHLDRDASVRLRKLMCNAAEFCDVSVIDLQVAGVFSGDDAQSTIARLLSTSETHQIDCKYVGACVDWLASVTGTSPTEVYAYIETGTPGNPRIGELIAEDIYRPTASRLAQLRVDFKYALSHSSSRSFLADTVPDTFLSERLFQQVLRSRVKTMEAPLQRFRVELDYHESEESAIPRPGSELILMRSGLDIFFGDRRDDALKSDERNNVVENLIGSVEVNGLDILVLDDRRGMIGHWIRASMEPFEIRAVFSQGISLRLYRGSLVRALYDASKSKAQKAQVEIELSIGKQARSQALAEWKLVRKLLLSFATDKCWLRNYLN